MSLSAHGRASTMLTSNRPVEDWGKLLGDTPAVTAMLDRLLEHGYVVTCGPKPKKQDIGVLGDEARGGELVDDRAVHLAIEVEVKGVERLAGVTTISRGGIHDQQF